MAQSALVRIERVVDFLAYHPTSGIIRSFPTSGIIRKTRIKQSANRLSSPAPVVLLGATLHVDGLNGLGKNTTRRARSHGAKRAGSHRKGR